MAHPPVYCEFDDVEIEGVSEGQRPDVCVIFPVSGMRLEVRARPEMKANGYVCEPCIRRGMGDLAAMLVPRPVVDESVAQGAVSVFDAILDPGKKAAAITFVGLMCDGASMASAFERVLDVMDGTTAPVDPPKVGDSATLSAPDAKSAKGKGSKS